jgi:threonine/homoserine/homoserine lactone efflux protein
VAVALAAAAVVGFGVGLVVSIPPTGPVALLVLRGALLGRARATVLLGLGSAVADIPYLLLGTLGYSSVIGQHPAVAAAFDAVAAGILLLVGARLLRDVAAGGRPSDPDTAASAGPLLRGAGLGLLNPSRILTWAVVASVVSPALPAPTLGGWAVYVAAVAAGEVAWTVALVWGWRRLSDRVPGGLDRWLLRAGAGAAFACAGAVVVRLVS